MARFPIRLGIAISTFCIGVVSASILPTRHHITSTTNVGKIQVSTPKPSQPPSQVVDARPTPKVILDYDPQKFNPRGDYYIIGRKPKGLRDFDGLELAVDHERASGGVDIQTDLSQRTGVPYTVSAFVTSKRLMLIAFPFSDEDFEYRFDGYFLRLGTLSNASRNAAVLKGTLSKWKDGVKLASAEVKFRIEYLGC
jgi:hypothetical protein